MSLAPGFGLNSYEHQEWQVGDLAVMRTSGYKRDPRVDDYIQRLPDWQQRICQLLRELIHAADADVTETIKRTVQPYFVLEGNICALLAAKDHVNLFLYDGGIVPDPEGIITAGHEQQDGENDRVPAGRSDQQAGPDGDPEADHRQQPRRRLAQTQNPIDTLSSC